MEFISTLYMYVYLNTMYIYVHNLQCNHNSISVSVTHLSFFNLQFFLNFAYLSYCTQLARYEKCIYNITLLLKHYFVKKINSNPLMKHSKKTNRVDFACKQIH